MLRIFVVAILLGRATSFTCDGRDLPDAYVNDGYCDCCDGTDEWNPVG